jgi:predicted RNase H-like nuclease (RuvC/YqgF family)
MSRPRCLLALAALLAAGTAGPLAAQASEASDTLVHRLAPIVITAEPETQAARRSVLGRLANTDADRRAVIALERENRSLMRTLVRQDTEIAQLEGRLDSLKTVVADSIERTIVSINGLTELTRSRRMQLEARLREAEVHGTTLSSALPENHN